MRASGRSALFAVLTLGLAGCEALTAPNGNPPDPTGVSVSAPATTVGIGATLQLTATVAPSGAPQAVTWSSSDATRLAVSGTGLVTAAVLPLQTGTVQVTATSTDDPSLSGSVDLTITCGPLLAPAVANGATLPEDTCYIATNPLTVSGGSLVLEPGVKISFATTGSLNITSGGSLNAVGTVDKGITLTSTEPAGSWRGLRFDGSQSTDNVLRYVTLENGGSAGWSGATESASALLLEDNTLVDIQQSTIVGSPSRGITLYDGAEMTFTANTLRDNAVPAWLHPNTVAFFSSGNTFDSNADEVVRVGFGNTDAVTTAQTWQDVGVPFEIQDRTFIEAPLTLDPGVVLESRTDVGIIVRVDGTLTAMGTVDDPIVFGSAQSTPGSWKGLQITTQSANNVFDNVVFEYGGGEAWTGDGDSRAMVYLDANSKALFTNSVFRFSDHYGLWVPSGGDIAGFDGNTFTGNARAMIVHPDRAGAITADNSFVSNTENRVRVTFGNTDAVTTAQTWNDFGTPFLVMDRTFVQAALQIAAGTELEFAQNASLIVNQGGSLGSTGTAVNKVAFRGREDLVGYWQGVQYATAAGANALTYVDFRNAGSQAWFGGSNSISTVHVTADGVASLANVTFRQTAGYAGIVSYGGSLACTAVDDGGYQYYVYSPAGAVQPTCPG